jgi:hypothetical protein
LAKITLKVLQHVCIMVVAGQRSYSWSMHPSATLFDWNDKFTGAGVTPCKDATAE